MGSAISSCDSSLYSDGDNIRLNPCVDGFLPVFQTVLCKLLRTMPVSGVAAAEADIAVVWNGHNIARCWSDTDPLAPATCFLEWAGQRNLWVARYLSIGVDEVAVPV